MYDILCIYSCIYSHILIHTPVLAPSGRPVQKHTNTNKQICGEGVSSGIESQTASFCDDGNVVGGDGLSLSKRSGGRRVVSTTVTRISKDYYFHKNNKSAVVRFSLYTGAKTV